MTEVDHSVTSRLLQQVN